MGRKADESLSAVRARYSGGGMKTETKQQIKLALRRFSLRWLRKAFDAIEDRLHAAEVRLREDLSQVSAERGGRTTSPLDSQGGQPTLCEPIQSNPRYAAVADSVASHNGCRVGRSPETFLEWEARRSGVAPVSKKAARARRQRPSAGAFDLRFAR
jgi:hypothetical protein